MHDDRLVRIASAAMEDYYRAGGERHLDAMRAALDAINASGIAWVAPWEAPLGGAWEGSTEDCWAEMRDAYLAEQKD